MAVNSRTHAARIAAIKAKPVKQKAVRGPKVFNDLGLTPEEYDDARFEPGMGQAHAGQEETAQAPAKKEPIRFTMLMADKICRLIAINTPLQAICAEPGMPSVGQVQTWIRKYPKFEEMYEEARALQADYVADEIVMIVRELRNTTVPGRASALRAAADLLAKQAEWRAPRKYGPKMDLSINERPKTPDEIKAEIERLRAELGVPAGRIARIK